MSNNIQAQKGNDKSQSVDKGNSLNTHNIDKERASQIGDNADSPHQRLPEPHGIMQVVLNYTNVEGVHHVGRQVAQGVRDEVDDDNHND